MKIFFFIDLTRADFGNWVNGRRQRELWGCDSSYMLKKALISQLRKKGSS